MAEERRESSLGYAPILAHASEHQNAKPHGAKVQYRDEPWPVEVVVKSGMAINKLRNYNAIALFRGKSQNLAAGHSMWTWLVGKPLKKMH